MQQNAELREYFGRASSFIPEMFNIAHAVSGSYDTAEYAVQCALSELWIGNRRGGLGFREELREKARDIALREALKQTPELTWELVDAQPDSAVSVCLLQESSDVQRMAVLRYGCELSAGQIARLTDTSEGSVRDVLARFEHRLGRSLPEGDRHRTDGLIAEWMKRSLSTQDRTMPALSMIYRSFESEMSEYVQSTEKKHRLSGLLRALLCIVLAVVCVGVFWLMTVLLQSTSPMGTQPGEAAVTEAEQGSEPIILNRN